MSENSLQEIEDQEAFAHIAHPKKRLMLETLEDCQGVVTVAARRAKISRRAHYHWLQEDEEYAAACKEINEVALDEAEEMLHKRMKESDALLIFYLKTKGKSRGYIERQENINMNGTFTVDIDDEPMPDSIPLEIDHEKEHHEKEQE